MSGFLYRRIVRPALFGLDPEVSHRIAIGLLRAWNRLPRAASAARRIVLDPIHAVSALGLRFDHRFGIAAGFDKNARALWGLYALGFAFVEVGSVSARAWSGNPRPRVWRVPANRALINRMGLPSDGAKAVAKRLKRRPPFPVFVNVAKTADPAVVGDAAVADIRRAVEVLAPVADAVVLNLSCPNTLDGRTFEEPAALEELLRALQDAKKSRPILLKISPDLSRPVLEAVADAALRNGVRGFVATNTTTDRTDLGPSPREGWPEGGVSGPPLREKAVATVRALRSFAGRGPVIVGCGGVEGPADMERFLEAGADLVEAYTGFIYEGPSFCRTVIRSSRGAQGVPSAQRCSK